MKFYKVEIPILSRANNIVAAAKPRDINKRKFGSNRLCTSGILMTWARYSQEKMFQIFVNKTTHIIYAITRPNSCYAPLHVFTVIFWS